MPRKPDATKRDGFVRVRGAQEHNLKNIAVDIPRDALVVFTGVSGSGKSSLAFGTLYAEAQRRYLESVSPYARRLFHQMSVPKVDTIEGLPPAVALQQQRGSPTTRSSVGSVTTLSNLLRMLYSRAGHYPKGMARLEAESFSTNTPEGACPRCHGIGRIYEATEQTMVPDPNLTIRERAVAAWPLAWGGQNLRDILVSMGIDVDIPWKDLPKKTRDWILFTDEQPTVPVYAGFTPKETRQALRQKMEPSYMGTFTGARRHVMHSFATTQSAMMKKRAAQYMLSSLCPECDGKRLRREALAVTFEGYDIADGGGRAAGCHRQAQHQPDGALPGAISRNLAGPRANGWRSQRLESAAPDTYFPAMPTRKTSLLNASGDLFAPAPTGAPATAGFRYAPDLFSRAAEQGCVATFETLPFKPFEFHGYQGNRRVVSYGYRYDYAGRALRTSEPMPDFLTPLREIASQFSGIAAERLEQALVTEYAPGAGIGWHRDKPMFEDVVALSFLAPCVLRLRRQDGTAWLRQSVEIAPRSVGVLIRQLQRPTMAVVA